MSEPQATEQPIPPINPRTLEASRTIVAAANCVNRESVTDAEAIDLIVRITRLMQKETNNDR